jgi:hypothetical protein
MGKKRDELKFLASLPPIQGAIRQGPDAMRIVLEVPGTEVPNALGIMLMHGKRLEVTVKVAKGQKPRSGYGV